MDIYIIAAIVLSALLIIFAIFKLVSIKNKNLNRNINFKVSKIDDKLYMKTDALNSTAKLQMNSFDIVEDITFIQSNQIINL